MLEVVIIDDEKIEAEGNKRRVLHMNHSEIESVRAFYLFGVKRWITWNKRVI